MRGECSGQRGRVAWLLRLAAALVGWLLVAGGVGAAGDSVQLGDSERRVRELLGSPQRVDRYPWFDTEVWIYGYTLVTLRNGVVYEYPEDAHLRFYRDDSGRVVRRYVYPGGEAAKPRQTPKPVARPGEIEEIVAGPSEPLPEAAPEKGGGETSRPVALSALPLIEILSLVKGVVSSSSHEQQTTRPVQLAESVEGPLFAEDGSYHGQVDAGSGRKKTVFVRGHYRADGTYVKSRYEPPGAPRKD